MKKVLILDDQQFIRDLFSREIEKMQDVTTVEAINGNEAMGKLKVMNPKPDLILADVVMPGKDGLAFLEEMQADPEIAYIPVIIVSSHAEDDVIARAKELGAREFINKAQLNDIDFMGLIAQYLQ